MKKGTTKMAYTEPKDYFPKEIRDKYFGKASTGKKTAPAKKPVKKGK